MKMQIAVLLLLLSPVPYALAAPVPAQTPPAAEDAAVHDELRALRDGMLDAMNKGDVERELAYLHPNVVVTWHDAEVSRGREGVRAYLDRNLKGPGRVVAAYRAEVNVDELTILYGSDTGIAFGSAREHYQLASGGTLDLPSRWTVTLVRVDGKWLIASLHESVNLFDNPLLAAARRTVWWAGGICLVLGLATGVAFGRRGRLRA